MYTQSHQRGKEWFPPRTFHLESMKPAARQCMGWFPSRQALIPERGGGEEKAVPKKKKRKEKCCDKPKEGGNVLLHVVGCFFPPNNLDTTVTLAKDIPRPVCTDEMCNFVIPTLPIFQNLLCPVVFLSAGILSSGGVPSEMETVFGLLLVPCSCPSPLPLPSLACGLDLQ